MDDQTYEPIVPDDVCPGQGKASCDDTLVHAQIEHDLPCRRCGYNLRGLNEDGGCPECGAPVWRSLLNDEIDHCYPGWIQILVRGLNFVLAGIAIEIVSAIVLYVLQVLIYARVPYEDILSLVLSLPLLAGTWLITSPEQGHPISGDSARIVARFLALGSYLIMIPEAMIRGVWPWVSFSVACMRTVLFLLVLVMMMHYMRGFAVRLNRPRLRHHSRLLKWGYVCQLAYFLVYIPLVISIYTSTNYAWFNLIDLWYLSYTLTYAGLMIWTLVLAIGFRRAMTRSLRYAQWDWANKIDFSQADKERRRHSDLKS